LRVYKTTQREAFRKAIDELISSYTRLIRTFSCEDFLKSSIDPFRFSFNAEIWGLKQAVRKEIEHKIEMKLEDLFGDFHENYLGNATHIPTGTRWAKIPSGRIPGIDIANQNLRRYIQIKSKFNSMNSSSAKRLARELGELKKKRPDCSVGCGWVVAGPRRKAIGESYIDEVGDVYKGKLLYSYVTGNQKEMDELVKDFPAIINEIKEDFNFEELLDNATNRIISELERRAKRRNFGVVEYLYNEAVR